jgi:hypothetical protein
MNRKRWFGIGLIATGVGLLFSQPNFTGLVISSETISPFDWITPLGIVFTGVGVALVSTRDRLERLLGEDAEPMKDEIQSLVVGKRGESSTNRKGVYEELYDVVSGNYVGGRPHTVQFTHKLNLPSGTAIMTRDADALNQAMNYSRSGIYRHVYDKSGESYMGIAKHIATGSDLKWVYRLKKPVRVRKQDG